MLASHCMRARRLACRYWAGRVALRENRARTHRLAGPRGSEAARPKINLLKSSRRGRPDGASLQPVPGVPPHPHRATQLGQLARGVVSFHLRTLAREGRMTVTIGRRELLAALGGTAATWPLAARAQQAGKVPIIGFLGTDASSWSPY